MNPARAKDDRVAAAPNVKLLLVGGHPEELGALQAMLDAPGQETVLAKSGAEALRQLLYHDFAAIILDVEMPEMDGFETALLIRQTQGSNYTPILFLTAVGGNKAALFRSYHAGAADYLVKPVPSVVLKSKASVFVQLKRQQGLVEAKNAELNAVIRELEAFSYTVAHDLRAPLAQIDGLSQALLEIGGRDLDEKTRQYPLLIREGTQRMCRLVDDLLMLSHVTRHDLRRKRVDLSAMARSIGAELRQREPERNVEIVVQPDVVAFGDQALLQSALFNLFDNAWKFTAGRSRSRIELGQFERDGEPVYYVRDDGAGFDMSLSQRLFQAFQRLHTASEFPGNGIGLATVARIVKRHGGKVWAEGALDQGATFYFSLAPEKAAG